MMWYMGFVRRLESRRVVKLFYAECTPPLLELLAAHGASAPLRIDNQHHMILPCISGILKQLHIHSSLDEWLPQIQIWVWSYVEKDGLRSRFEV